MSYCHRFLLCFVLLSYSMPGKARCNSINNIGEILWVTSYMLQKRSWYTYTKRVWVWECTHLKQSELRSKETTKILRFGFVKNKNADRLRFRSFAFDSQRKNRIRGCSAGHNKSQTAQAFPPTTIYFMAIYFIPCVRPTMWRHGHSHKIRALRLMLHSITEPVTFSLLNTSQRSHVHSVHDSPHHIRIKIILSDSFFSPDSFYVVEFKIYEKTN